MCHTENQVTCSLFAQILGIFVREKKRIVSFIHKIVFIFLQVSSGGSSGGSRGSRGSSNKPPPGAVNLERSYQICQAVIQNSPNRDQLRCQLKLPPSLLAANASSSGSNNKKSEGSVPPRAATQYGVVTSSRNGSGPPNTSVSGKPFTPPLPAPGGYPMVPGSNGLSVAKPVTSLGGQGKVTSSRGGTYHQRQQSPPVVVRHVFTSSQGIPVTMAVLPQSQAPPEVSQPVVICWLLMQVKGGK